jgi:putative FmdB family regulatory protein
MPIYEYECTKCSHYLEALQKIADKPLRECPECGKHSLKRLISAPMFRLSGSGWYETDFKSDKENKRNLVDKGDKDAPAADPKPATDAKSDGKDDGKSDAKSGPKPNPRAPTRRVTVNEVDLFTHCGDGRVPEGGEASEAAPSKEQSRAKR